MSLKTEVYMHQVPKVSVITVVYNGIAHLEQTIQSVINQTYENIEYIIIDGGSTDGTVALLEKYDEHIEYWTSEEDSGIYDAMNKGIAKATGEIVGLINADDWYEQDAVRKVVETFLHSGAGVVHGSMNIVKENGTNFLKYAQKNVDNLKKGMVLNHSTIFAKRELYVEHGSFDTNYKIVADWEKMLQWWLADVTFVAVDDEIASFRIGGVSSEHLKKSFAEKHSVRDKHQLYYFVDWFFVYDRVKSILPGDVLLSISLFRQKKIGA